MKRRRDTRNVHPFSCDCDSCQGTETDEERQAAEDLEAEKEEHDADSEEER
jgi:hypothetical protein